jgi:aspartyl-tRNA(Asn)/glutamyl-tRNA(Gln) amidotransferase subunit A
LALQQARQADADFAAGLDRGPLQGIPYGAKDLLTTRGYPTTWGAAPFQDRVIDDDATVITRLREAGAVLVAKLSMVELAGGLGYQQANAAFNGPGLNPWDTTRWSGGSSSGPGSAVAAGLVPFAIGSETWGSIVTPAAYCGLSGLRPTYGRVSRHGAMSLSWSMDKLGPMGRRAHDCGLVLQAISGADPLDASAVDRAYAYPDETFTRRRFRLGILAGAADRVQPAVAEAFQASLELLEQSCEVEETRLPDLPYATVADIILSAESAATHETLVLDGTINEMTAPEDRYRLYADMTIPATDFLHACALRSRMQRALDEFFAQFDAIVTPTRSTTAGPIDRPFSEWSRGFSSSPIGGAANVCGLPGLSIPNGFDADGLPTGLQLTGRAFEEDRLLAIANLFQEQTDWHRRHPTV